jgi:hypothetical protein
MDKKVLYLHRKKSDDTIFYVGIGNKKRAKSKRDRNVFWENTVKKYGYYYEIVEENLTWEEACHLEKKLIREIGRRDLGLGTLVNLTDGGEGNSNWNDNNTHNMIQKNIKNMKPVSQYDKNGKLICTYRSISFASKETGIRRQTIRDTALGKVKTAGGYAWEYSHINYKHNKERFDKGSSIKKGSKNAMSKTVINLQTGIFYESISLASQSQVKLTERTFKAQLSGQNKNKTDFIIA